MTHFDKDQVKEEQGWDFFIAHAGTDRQTAQALYHLLRLHSRAFLDSECLLPGDDWDWDLALAQRNSRITIVLISSTIEDAYYAREEIASAIAMARENRHRHRIIPIYLDAKRDNVPYGLRLKHGFSVSDELSLKTISEHLLQLLARLDGVPGTAQPQKRSSKAIPNMPESTLAISQSINTDVTERVINQPLSSSSVEDTYELNKDDVALVMDRFIAVPAINSRSHFVAEVSPDLETLALAISNDKKVRLINTHTGKVQLQINIDPNELTTSLALRFSPNSLMLIVSGRLFKVLTGELIRVFFHKKMSSWSFTNPMMRAIFSPDGKMLAGLCADKTIKLWDVETATIRHVIQYNKECTQAFDFSPCSKYFASVFNSRTLNIWDWATDQKIKTIQSDECITSVKFSPDGNLLATTEGSSYSKWDSGSRNMSVKLRDIHTGQLINTNQDLQPTRLPVIFSPTNDIIATSTKEQRSIRLHHVGTGRLIKEIFTLEWGISPLAFSRNGKFLACVESNKNIVWRVLSLDS